MSQTKVVLVTGVSGYWGGQVASRLIAQAGLRLEDAYNGRAGLHVIGLDREPPDPEIKGLDFIQADIRNPLLVELLREERVHTVCHLAFLENLRPSEATFDLNVIGAMKVLGACAEAGVRKAILKSSTAVYGAHPTNPAFLTEQQPLNGSRRYGYTRDQVEVEAFCNGFRRQVPELSLTILRFPNILGATADTPMVRFLREPLSPTLLGFDPMMQVIHERDVVEALIYAVQNDCPGVFNVAAEGVLPLSKLTRLAAKMPVPVVHLFAYWGEGLLNGTGSKTGRFLPIELDYLRYPWVADLKRMREELGFTPRYTAEEALREFAGHQRLRQYISGEDSMAYDEERLRDTIERRRRARERFEHDTALNVEAEETMEEGSSHE